MAKSLNKVKLTLQVTTHLKRNKNNWNNEKPTTSNTFKSPEITLLTYKGICHLSKILLPECGKSPEISHTIEKTHLNVDYYINVENKSEMQKLSS